MFNWQRRDHDSLAYNNIRKKAYSPGHYLDIISLVSKAKERWHCLNFAVEIETQTKAKKKRAE
jgi:hypothetical protein